MIFNKFLRLFFLFSTISSINGTAISGINSINDVSNISYEDKNINDVKGSGLGNNYLLGPGDSLIIVFFGLPELSGKYGIGPDGIIDLPQIGRLYVNSLTLPELKSKLIEEYKNILIDPNINVRLSKVRPVRVYVKGEVKKPGFYILSIDEMNFTINSYTNRRFRNNNELSGTQLETNNLLFPTLYDSLKASMGITPYSDLSKIKVIRINSLSEGGGKIETELNFLSLFLEGDQTTNIRLFDGDTIIVPKSDISLKDQLLEVNNTNMNPDFVKVFVSGKVKSPGFIELPRGAGLNQAIAMTGGKELLSGRVEFVRFKKDGAIDRRVFSYKQSSSLDSKRNPILEDGDIVNVRDSIFGTTTYVLGKVLEPVTPILFIEELID